MLSHIGNFNRCYPELCNDKNGIDEGYENISQQLDKYGPCIQSSEEGGTGNYSLAMALVEEIAIWDNILRQKGADQRTVPALAQQLRSRFVHEINGEKHNHYRSYSTLQPNEYQQESYQFLEQCSSQEFFIERGGGGEGLLGCW